MGTETCTNITDTNANAPEGRGVAWGEDEPDELAAVAAVCGLLEEVEDELMAADDHDLLLSEGRLALHGQEVARQLVLRRRGRHGGWALAEENAWC